MVMRMTFDHVFDNFASLRNPFRDLALPLGGNDLSGMLRASECMATSLPLPEIQTSQGIAQAFREVADARRSLGGMESLSAALCEPSSSSDHGIAQAFREVADARRRLGGMEILSEAVQLREAARLAPSFSPDVRAIGASLRDAHSVDSWAASTFARIDQRPLGESARVFRPIDVASLLSRDGISRALFDFPISFSLFDLRHGNELTVRRPDVSAALDPAAPRHALARVVDDIFESMDDLRREARQASQPTSARARATPDAPLRGSSKSIRLVEAEPQIRGPANRRPASLGVLHIYCGSAPEDERLREALFKHLWSLRRDPSVELWHEGQIPPGADHSAVVRQRIEMSHVLLLLLSSDYMDQLRQRNLIASIEAAEGRLLPVVVRATYLGDSVIERRQRLPKNGQALVTWQHQDTAWVEVAEALRERIQTLRAAGRRLFN